MTKKEMIEDPNSCFNKAADNEPLFVLRAQDIFAPMFVKKWAETLSSMRLGEKKIAGAWRVVEEMLRWPNRKIPD